MPSRSCGPAHWKTVLVIQNGLKILIILQIMSWSRKNGKDGIVWEKHLFSVTFGQFKRERCECDICSVFIRLNSNIFSFYVRYTSRLNHSLESGWCNEVVFICVVCLITFFMTSSLARSPGSCLEVVLSRSELWSRFTQSCTFAFLDSILTKSKIRFQFPVDLSYLSDLSLIQISQICSVLHWTSHIEGFHMI